MGDTNDMDDPQLVESIGLGVANGCLVATVQIDLTDEAVGKMQADVLARVEGRHFRGAIFDVSAVQVLDTLGFRALVDTARMVRLLGVPSVIVGLRPGVVASLVELESDFSGLWTARALDDAFAMLEDRGRGRYGGRLVG